MSDPLLLDTHCWIWFVSGAAKNFEKKSIRAIERACLHGECLVSVISVWEAGMLAARGRVRIRMPVAQWVNQALETPGMNLVPLSVQAALDSSALPGEFPGDPADRMLVATARQHGATLVTADQKILRYAKYCSILPA
jgi:PIN domain nuclease of toxin-antitoxin system